MCTCLDLSTHLEQHQSDSPVASKRPSSRSEASESSLASKRPRTAEKSSAEQVRGPIHRHLLQLIPSDVHQTLIKLFELGDLAKVYLMLNLPGPRYKPKTYTSIKKRNVKVFFSTYLVFSLTLFYIMQDSNLKIIFAFLLHFHC